MAATHQCYRQTDVTAKTAKRRKGKGGNCYKGEGKGAKRKERGRKGTGRRRKRKGKGGKERRCAVGIFNYFRLCKV